MKPSKILTKLIIGYLILCGIAFTVLYFGHRTVTETYSLLSAVLEEKIRPLARINKIISQTNELRLLEMELTRENDIFGAEGLIQRIEAEKEALQQELEAFPVRPDTAEDPLVVPLWATWRQYVKSLDSTVALVRKGEITAAFDNFRFDSFSRFHSFLALLEHHTLQTEQQAKAEYNQASTQLARLRITYIGVSAGVTLLGLLLVVIMARSLSNRLNRLRDGAQALADGELEHPVTVSGNDELSDLARSFNEMRHAIREQIKDLSQLNRKVLLQNQELEEHRDNLEKLVEQRTRKLLESEQMLRHAQKMEAIGILAGGIAHDFNNILQGISGYAQMLRRENRGNSQNTHLDQIESIADRGAELVRRILAFSRKMETSVEATDVNAIIENVVSLLSRTIPKNITIHTDLDCNLCYATVDATQMEQILINISKNSIDAMPDGGSISIDTDNILVGPEIEELQPGRYVRIRIVDTGVGMDEKIRQRVFDPFFTTKDVGKGTGLGLSSAYGIVKMLGGAITCESRPRQGSTFTIYLPALEGKPPSGPTEEGRQSPLSGKETILLVDDESMILETTAVALEDHGYTVLTAQNGDAAMRTFRENQPLIDVVITDLGMPGMTGEQLLKELRALQPELPIIIATGYIGHDILNDPKRFGASDQIAKPFKVDQLLTSVRTVLDKRGGAA